LNKRNRILAVILAALMLMSMPGCKDKNDDKKKKAAQTENSLEKHVETVADETEKEIEDVTDEVTEEIPLAEPSEEKKVPVSESQYYSFTQSSAEDAEPLYKNPLTGLGTAKDLTSKRPAAIMVNNIAAAMPQVGISQADIVYECLAEGGITRLLMVASDYENLGKVGSVRSSRPYYLDFAANHDAIYVHAGGSDDAYAQIRGRDVDNMDGVNGSYAGTIFYRDPERVATMAYEHTMVTEGARLKQGMELFGYRDTVSSDFVNPVSFPVWGYNVELSGDKAEYVKIPYNTKSYDTQIVEYEYDANTGKYLRYQFNHKAHIDGTTGDQLAFDNIIVLNVPHYATGDSYGHRNVNTVGNGDGYYIAGGKKISINWSKESKDGNITFTTEDSKPLVINRGKTVINIVENSTFNATVIQ